MPEIHLPKIHVTVWDGPENAARAVFVHGSTTWGPSAFARQRPLATEHRLELVDRRGYGRSPDVEHSDAVLDAQDLLDVLGGGPAHLVGHSFGTVGALLAAGRAVDAVRSLTLIEPSCYRAVADDPVVSAALERNRAAIAAFGDRPLPSAEDYLRLSTESVGMPPLEPTPERLRAAGTAMRERPCWDVEVPMEEVAAAPWPKLVINGSWEDAPAAYREAGGVPLMACGRATAARIGAELLVVPGSAHEPHWDQAEIVNDALRRTWARAGG
ncbi:alpha/beta fold hydrolase [Pseudonocardia sichuanensis]